MGVNAKKALTKGEETSQEGDRIGDNVMQLRPGESKEIQQKRMRGERKAPVEVRKEEYTLIGPRVRFDLTWTGKTTPLARKKAIVLVTTDLLRRHDGGHVALTIREKEIRWRGRTQGSPEQGAWS